MFCFRDIEGKLNRCARCKFTHYCNTACQKKDWLIHKVSVFSSNSYITEFGFYLLHFGNERS